jgi:hypothetical protein
MSTTMKRVFVLRNKEGEFFAGLKQDIQCSYSYVPTFVPREAQGVAMIMMIGEDQLDEVKETLMKYRIEFDQVQIG